MPILYLCELKLREGRACTRLWSRTQSLPWFICCCPIRGSSAVAGFVFHLLWHECVLLEVQESGPDLLAYLSRIPIPGVDTHPFPAKGEAFPSGLRFCGRRCSAGVPEEGDEELLKPSGGPGGPGLSRDEWMTELPPERQVSRGGRGERETDREGDGWRGGEGRESYRCGGREGENHRHGAEQS